MCHITSSFPCATIHFIPMWHKTSSFPCAIIHFIPMCHKTSSFPISISYVAHGNEVHSQCVTSLVHMFNILIHICNTLHSHVPHNFLPHKGQESCPTWGYLAPHGTDKSPKESHQSWDSLTRSPMSPCGAHDTHAWAT